MAKVMFKMPSGDEEFDSMEKGEKMKVLCTIMKEGPDKGCLVAVKGATLPGYEDGEEGEEMEEVEEESYGDETDLMAVMEEEMPTP